VPMVLNELIFHPQFGSHWQPVVSTSLM